MSVVSGRTFAALHWMLPSWVSTHAGPHTNEPMHKPAARLAARAAVALAFLAINPSSRDTAHCRCVVREKLVVEPDREGHSRGARIGRGNVIVLASLKSS